MNTLVLLQSIIVVAGLMIAFLLVAYLSNTGRLPTWTKDAWQVLTVILLGVYVLDVVFDTSLPGIVCIISLAVVVNITVLVAMRRE